MERYTNTVSAAHEGSMLLQYLKAAQPLLPQPVLKRALKNRDIKINGVRVGEDGAVRAGDTVDVYTPYAAQQPDVVFEDENICIINKPAGISSQSDLPDEQSVQSWAASAYPAARICHRLDNQTSGLMLIAKTQPAYDALLLLFKQRSIEKRYQCLVAGCPQEWEAVRTAWLRKDREAGRVQVFPTPGAGRQRIVTEYRVLEAGEISRLEVTLHTGRTHQIRAHMAFLGFPLIGDEVYGSRQINRAQKAKKLRLCATELVLHVPSGVLSYLDNRAFRIDAPF